MPLETGARLGPYEILGPLGAGGMGEVYQARDTRLDRSVAIKILPGHLSSDPALRQRFEREARSVSALNHPHICTLHDIGEQDGVDFLVMEYLEGETLASRLEKGPVPLDETLRYATQVADALTVAHRQGFVHRDLKPGNIMLTRSGAKLLDFGLAKAADAAGGPLDMTAAATATTPLTAEGTIVGTFQYMAPEQLEGGQADTRSDLFALGMVIYEMVTGRKAFSGKTQASLVASILKEDPRPLASVAPMSPPALERLVGKCLSKDPDARWQSASDLADELRWISEAGSQAGVPLPVAARRRGRERTAWLVAGVLGAAVIALGAVLWGTLSTEPARTTRFMVSPPRGVTLRPIGPLSGPVEVSPDGRNLVFGGLDASGDNVLWIRSMDSLEPRPLKGTEGGMRPFWSPDSRMLGFFTSDKLRKIDVTGGPPLTLCPAESGRGGTWNADGTIVFAARQDSGLMRVASSGGEPAPVTQLDESLDEETHRYPWFLPDGRRFLYLARSPGQGNEPSRTTVWAASLDGGERRQILQGTSQAVFASGHILFVRDGTLMAQAFDADSLQTAGDPFPLAEGVQYDRRYSRGVFSASAGGTLAFQSGTSREESVFQSYDRDGKPLDTIGPRTSQSGPAFSPDGKRLAFNNIDSDSGNWDVWIHEIDRNVRTRFTFGETVEAVPLWTPDQSSIIYSGRGGDDFDIFIKPASGAGRETLLFDTEGNSWPISITADGKTLIVQIDRKETASDIVMLDMTSKDAAPVPLLESSFDEETPRLSPDGRWLAYVSDESGRDEIYVAPFPSMQGKWQISSNGGDEPVWDPRGGAIYFIASPGTVMKALISTDAAGLALGAVSPLFETTFSLELGFSLTISPDGSRLVANVSPDSAGSSTITIVLGWDAAASSK